MVSYRFYPLDKSDAICGPYSAAACEDDQAALQWADELVGGNGFGVEVWQGARLVCRRLAPSLTGMAGLA